MNIFDQMKAIESEIPEQLEVNLEENRLKEYAMKLLQGEIPEDLGHLSLVELKQFQIKAYGVVIQV